MKIHRLYADADGESHFGEVEVACAPLDYAPPAPAFDVSQPVGAARYVMVRFPAGWDSDFHVSPRRQMFVLLSGEFEGATSDGAVVTLTAGDAVLMEDTTGKGHTARVIGAADVHAMMVHLE